MNKDIQDLRRQRTELETQAAETLRLEAWRAQAVRQAAAGGPRGFEVEVRPIYILPDTNCYIDWLEGVACLTNSISNYTVLVPIIGRLVSIIISMLIVPRFDHSSKYDIGSWVSYYELYLIM